MQKKAPFTIVTKTAALSGAAHGQRAKCIQRLIRLDMPVPHTVALGFDVVHKIANGTAFDLTELLAGFGADPLVSVRPSPEYQEWGGPSTVLDVGMNDALLVSLSEAIGSEAARSIYLRFIVSFAVDVARLDPELFDDVDNSREGLLSALDIYQEEMDEPFPQDPAEQLATVLRSMARAWEGPSARLLRQSRGAPVDAGLGLVVQRMALGLGAPESGSGVIQFVSSETGHPQITGRYLSQSQGREALAKPAQALYLERDTRGLSLEEVCPEGFAELQALSDILRTGLREEMQIEFALDAGKLSVLDAVKVPRAPRAAVRIAVSLAESGVITKEDALLRIEPRALPELLHRQVDMAAPRDVIARGMAASPGAATGVLVFSAAAAQAAAAQDTPCILVRPETAPEDIRGMHAAAAVMTQKGGMTSHAAVIARGLGKPCIVGTSGAAIDVKAKQMTLPGGRVFAAGDTVTLDGTAGECLAGEVPLIEPSLDGSFRTLMAWADQARDIGIRVNADTPADAEVARRFDADGIGLCRTEHMFFDEDRLTVMHEMIFAETAEARAAALERLLPMQRADFGSLFEIMRGKPVCIRLFDPPLHEFLPTSREGVFGLAEALDLSVSTVSQRIEALSEYNPMLGMRGVRLGIAMPEIYDMQARAIFEATLDASLRGAIITPEIMLPLVSARREVELIKSNIDAVAAAVRTERGVRFNYRLGVMVETPRAALKAGEIAEITDFLSFGTNDLTQMTYGLSRDDAGRFMGSYVQQGVFSEDPFHTLDADGVGELLNIAADRGRATRSDLTLSICGEHGGDPDSIDFCRKARFTYVSCSPFRVPVARMAAAHLALTDVPMEKKPRRFNILGRVLRSGS
ncbi:putative PEP-binding protein [Tropicimonas sp. S265A]|uniref:putative PEP-binding protein n=1 Tax=Tropicimonas sp. S265A TaxID=3415134 RepID=UPI003C7A04C3